MPGPVQVTGIRDGQRCKVTGGKVHMISRNVESLKMWIAEVQPWLIQGIRSGDGVGDLFIYLFIKDIKNNRMRIAQ